MDRKQSTGGAHEGSGRGKPPEGGGDFETRVNDTYLIGWHVTSGPPGTPLLGEREGAGLAKPKRTFDEKFKALDERISQQFNEFEANAIQIGEKRGFEKALSSARAWLVASMEQEFGQEAAEQVGGLAGTGSEVEPLLAIASLLGQCDTADDFLRQAAATE